ncbi:MAG: PAS domain S-box protein [Desulfurivibrio sp.]|nr:PAS domain S-box protein [Desulfurivibrio sp.]
MKRAIITDLRNEGDFRFPLVLLLFFSLLAACIVVGGFLAYKSYERNYTTEVERQLSAIADLKVNQLVQYRRERMEDAGLLFDNASLAALVRRHLEHPEDTTNRLMLQRRIDKLQSHYQYDRVRLIDTSGTTRLSSPKDLPLASSGELKTLSKIMHSGRVAFSDFYRSDHDQRVYLAVSIPILDRFNGNQRLGLLSLRIDPEQYLYPFIQRWPVPSRTAETLLVRREEQEVVFLNELRFQKNTALKLRFPLTKTNIPAVRAVLGQTGIVKGYSHQNVPVIADIRPIPDSPWFLVTRVSTSEAYAPLREGLWAIGGLIALLLFTLGAIAAFIWQRQRTVFYRKQHDTLAALDESETRYRHLYESMTDGFAQTTMTGEIVKVNRPFLNMLGYSEEEALRLTYRDLTPEKWHAFEQQLIETQIVPSGSSELYEKEYIRKDNSVFPIELKTYLLRDDQGVPSGMWAMVRDISERKKSETALRESQQLFATVASNSPALIWMSGLDKGCTWFNQPWLTFTGRDMTEELGSGWTAGVHPNDLTLFLQRYNESFESRQPFVMEYRLRRHDGEYRWLLDQGQPRYDAANVFAGYIGSCLDITVHKTLENQVRHAVKMESIGTLAGGVAHDFNNILMAIIGYGQLTLMSMSQDDPQRLNIEHMLEGADRAARLTKDLLLFSRKQVSERKPVDLDEIIKTVEKFIVRVIGEDIACKTRLPEQPLIILADSHQLEQVLMNFATNARDAMPKGGTFSVTAEQTILNQDFTAAHGFGRPGLYALLTVSDNGCGMDEQTRNRIFDPFFTTKEVGKGTGLGLAVVYGIIKQHEGYINVYSEPGRGATFRIYLPLVVAESPEKIIEEKEQPPAHGTETILIAEDDESLRTLAVTALTRFGYTVIEAVDGEEAVQKFKENQTAIKLLLFDIVMPKMNGQEAYEAIRNIRPDIKAIFMSGYAPEMIREKAALESTAPLLAKPLSPTELLKKVRDILDR